MREEFVIKSATAAYLSMEARAPISEQRDRLAACLPLLILRLTSCTFSKSDVELTTVHSIATLTSQIAGKLASLLPPSSSPLPPPLASALTVASFMRQRPNRAWKTALCFTGALDVVNRLFLTSGFDYTLVSAAAGAAAAAAAAFAAAASAPCPNRYPLSTILSWFESAERLGAATALTQEAELRGQARFDEAANLRASIINNMKTPPSSPAPAPVPLPSSSLDTFSGVLSWLLPAAFPHPLDAPHTTLAKTLAEHAAGLGSILEAAVHPVGFDGTPPTEPAARQDYEEALRRARLALVKKAAGRQRQSLDRQVSEVMNVAKRSEHLPDTSVCDYALESLAYRADLVIFMATWSHGSLRRNYMELAYVLFEEQERLFDEACTRANAVFPPNTPWQERFVWLLAAVQKTYKPTWRISDEYLGAVQIMSSLQFVPIPHLSDPLATISAATDVVNGLKTQVHPDKLGEWSMSADTRVSVLTAWLLAARPTGASALFLLLDHLSPDSLQMFDKIPTTTMNLMGALANIAHPSFIESEEKLVSILLDLLRG